MAFLCLLAINTGMFKKVYLVFDNKHLMERDKAEFERLWLMMGCSDHVEYCIGYGFQPGKDSLILVDESDTGMFESPRTFEKLIDGQVCVCLTATPNNCKEDGVETQVIEALGFQRYNYVLNDIPDNLAA
jgi:hypothetical protein